MTVELANYWGQLRNLRNTIHPDDAAVFRRVDAHGFNLDFPPPAFIGDVANSPIIILENNGGYDPIMTPNEFPDQAAHQEFVGYLLHLDTSIPLHVRHRPTTCAEIMRVGCKLERPRSSTVLLTAR
jgi:hypothetical protein